MKMRGLLCGPPSLVWRRPLWSMASRQTFFAREQGDDLQLVYLTEDHLALAMRRDRPLIHEGGECSARSLVGKRATGGNPSALVVRAEPDGVADYNERYACVGIDVRLHAYRPGGIATYALELARALIASNEGEGEYIVLQHRRESAPLIHGAKWARLQTPPHHRLEGWSLSAELAPLQLDVLHSTDFIPPRRGARRQVITIHDLAFLRYPQFLTREARRYYNRQIRSAVRRADHILAVSEATKTDIVEMLQVQPERITVQHHGYRSEFRPFTPEEERRARAHWRLPEDYFLFVGTMEPRKNIGALLAGYRQLRAEMPAAPPLLLCAPPGWGSDDILQELENAPGVWWRDRVPAAALPAFYACARALLLPSHYEGFWLAGFGSDGLRNPDHRE